MNRSVRSFTTFLLSCVMICAVSSAALAQPNSYPYRVAQDRMLWHDYVDKEQLRLLQLGGVRNDSIVRLSKDEAVNLEVTDALIRQVDELQEQIELDSTLNTNNKKRYLRGLTDVLQRFEKAVQSKEIPASQAPGLIDAFVRAMQLDRKGESIEPVIAGGSY